MNDEIPSPWKIIHQRWLSRRSLMRGAVGAGALGVGLSHPKFVYGDVDRDEETCLSPRPIPGGVTALKPFGIFVHHNPLNTATPLPNLSDPSQITDFDGSVGLTHIRGGGTGTNTSTGDTTRLAFQADMGFSQGKFIGSDGRLHRGTFAFV